MRFVFQSCVHRVLAIRDDADEFVIDTRAGERNPDAIRLANHGFGNVESERHTLRDLGGNQRKFSGQQCDSADCARGEHDQLHGHGEPGFHLYLRHLFRCLGAVLPERERG